MSLRPSMDRLKLDKRMVDINLKNRTLTKAEIEKHLNALPDLADKAMNLNFAHNLGNIPSNMKMN